MNGSIASLILKISSARELNNWLNIPDTFPGEIFPLPSIRIEYTGLDAL